MKLFDVFDALNKGEKVRRAKWDKDSFLFLQNNNAMYSCRGGKPESADTHGLFDWQDLTANDWSVI